MPRSWVKTSCMKPVVLLDQTGSSVGRAGGRAGEQLVLAGRVRHAGGAPSRRGRCSAPRRPARPLASTTRSAARRSRRRPRHAARLPTTTISSTWPASGGRTPGSRVRCTPRWSARAPSVVRASRPWPRASRARSAPRRRPRPGRRGRRAAAAPAASVPGRAASAGGGTASRRRAPTGGPAMGPGSRSTRVIRWPCRARSIAAVIPLGPEPTMAMWRVMVRSDLSGVFW